MKKLVIIPAFNEEKTIKDVVENLEKLTTGYDYIIINDGSNDNTEQICRQNNLKHISLPQNLGIGGAVQTGYKYAKENNYDVAIQIDGDGQHDVTYLDSLVKKLDTGVDMCIGSRYIDKQGFQSSFMRRMGKNVISGWMKMLCGKKITDPTSGFRACNKKIIKMFSNDYPYDYAEPESIVRLLKNKYIVAEIPVVMKPRQGGKSSITPIKSFNFMIKVILSMLFARLDRRKNKCY